MVAERPTPRRTFLDTSSPELVLVDPLLAAIERQRLPYPDDTVGRLAASRPREPEPAVIVTRSTIAPVDPVLEDIRRVAESLRTMQQSLPVPVASRRPRSRRRAAALVLLVGIVVALVLVGRALDGERPTVLDSAAIGEPPASSAELPGAEPGANPTPAQSGGHPPATPTTPNQAPAGKRTASPAPQSFAWAPTPGASGYHVELFSGSERIYAADTVRPTLPIPKRWKQAGRVRRLTPGEYRWYVWPVVSGRRQTRAVVQAKLVIPSGF